MRLLRPGVALGILALSALAARPAAAASPSLQWGYWWAAETGPVAVPAPPQAPQDGLYVSSSAAGAQAVSAVRFTLATDQADPRLVLRVHSINQVDGLSLAAYPTTTAWHPGSSQQWSSRPSYGPTSAGVPGALSADQSTVTFDLRSLLSGATVNVVIAPATSASTPGQYPTFDASFDAPNQADIITTHVETQQAPASPPLASTPNDIAAPQAAASTAPSQAVTPAVAPAPYQSPAGQPLVAAIPAGTTNSPLPVASSPHPLKALSPATRVVSAGRSTRDTIGLAFLLVDGLVFLIWSGRAVGRGRVRRPSIYDLPFPSPTGPTPVPAADSGTA